MVSLLQGHRAYNAAEIAIELDVSRRTVFRDLKMLEASRIPCFYHTEHKGYRIPEHFFFPAINLTLGEALAMLLLTGRAKQGDSLPLLAQGAQAAAKIESVLPAKLRKEIGGMMPHFSIRRAPKDHTPGSESHFSELTHATRHRIQCTIRYDSFFEGKVIQRRVYPLRLVFQHRAWYVLAYTPKDRDTRTYKLSRIQSLELLEKRFSDAYDETLANHFGQAWAMIPEGKVSHIQLHFEAKVAGNVAEVIWHESQRVEWNDDGSLEFHVDVDGVRDISWWILGYGDQCRVVEPPALVELVAGAARRMAALYE
jgi:predicted DNA-binding transcriptional regulator YafY